MKRIALLLNFVFLALISFHCQKEISIIRGPVNNNTPTPVSATIQGKILDETGSPAPGVNIRVGSKTAITDSRGFFRILNASLDKNASLVTAEKAGYYKAYRSFSATTGANHVEIKLIRKTLAGTIASAGGEVTLSNGSKIALPANAVVKASGGSYSGTVNVYAAYIDPTAGDIASVVPGSFMADDRNNNRVTLASYGMIAVELESTAGEKLQIATGNSATLTMPIPSSIQSSAPATIALWSVNEQTGIWKEEGTATRSGSNYVGTVSHFSFWNCDISIPAVNLSMTIKDEHAVPLVHAHVRLTRQNPGSFSQSHGWTDSIGQVSGLVPANEPLLLEVLDPCGNALYSQNIGPFAQNTNLGTITVSTSGSNNFVTITGTVLNCSAAPVTDGEVIIVFDNTVRYISTNATGGFSTTIMRCSSSPATVDITVIDNSTQQQGTTSTVTLTSPTTNAGTLIACGVSTTQFINYTLDGTNISITSANAGDSLMAYSQPNGTTLSTTVFTGARFATNDYVTLRFNSPATPASGTYPAISVSVQNFQQTTLINPFNIIVTNFPAVGGFFEGSFTGQFTVSSNTHTLSGTFRLRRLM